MWVVILVKYELKAVLCLYYMFEVTHSKPENMPLYTHKNITWGNTTAISPLCCSFWQYIHINENKEHLIRKEKAGDNANLC